MLLETRYAETIAHIVENARDAGLPHVVVELLPSAMCLQPYQVNSFASIDEALDDLDAKMGCRELPGSSLGHPIYYQHADDFLEALRQANPLTKNNNSMNLNNLENLKNEMKSLGFSKELQEKMEENMKNNLPEFILKDQVAGQKGQIDLNLYFKQSGQSANYYLNKYDVALNEARPLEAGQKYLVISPSETPGKNNVWKRENVAEAIEVFKKHTGNAELAVGKDAAHKTRLVSMEAGKINYMDKEFGRTFRNPPLPQTIWVERGKGFTASQSINLIEGRAVYREDMLTQGGHPYKAWMKLDLDGPRDRYMNFNMNQYHDPSYGFNLKEVLDKFNIKELDDPKERAKLEAQLKNGDRPFITVDKNGEQVKLQVEAVPRYSQLNMFALSGKPEKREQFLKEPSINKEVIKSKGKEVSASQGLGV
ncbi:hypothetical protein ACTJKC_15340 [Pedobacter sp. 22226]|uniref:hypothetical protein n=1 Tax=Pedobacter sp. 22226 TaxID=3453894 RepID=UPI003F825ED8